MMTARADSKLLYLLVLPMNTLLNEARYGNDLAVSAMTQRCTSIAWDHTAHTGHSYNNTNEVSEAKQGSR